MQQPFTPDNCASCLGRGVLFVFFLNFICLLITHNICYLLQQRRRKNIHSRNIAKKPAQTSAPWWLLWTEFRTFFNVPRLTDVRDIFNSGTFLGLAKSNKQMTAIFMTTGRFFERACELCYSWKCNAIWVMLSTLTCKWSQFFLPSPSLANYTHSNLVANAANPLQTLQTNSGLCFWFSG